MGHRFSKTAAIRQNEAKRKSLPAQRFSAAADANAYTAISNNRHSLPATAASLVSSSRITSAELTTAIPPTAAAINLEFESAEATTPPARRSNKRTYTNSCSSNSSARQIIIKIQLAKMENGNHEDDASGVVSPSGDTTATATIRLDQLQQAGVTPAAHSSDSRNSNIRTAGSSANSTLLLGHINAIQIDAATTTHATGSSRMHDNDLVEYCEVLEQDSEQEELQLHRLAAVERQAHLCEEEALLNANNNNNNTSINKCCNRKTRNALSAAAGTALAPLTTTPTTSGSRRRCCKCTCRDAFRRLIEPKYYKNKQQAKALAQAQQQQQQQQLLPQQPQHSTELQWTGTATAATLPAPAPLAPTPYPSIPAEAIACLRNLPNIAAGTATCSTTTITATPITTTTNNTHANTSNSSASNMVNSQLSIWASNPHNRQFVVVSCPPTSVLTVGHVDEHSIRLLATEDIEAMQRHEQSNNTGQLIESNTGNSSITSPQPQSMTAPNSPHTPGPTVHSQVDYMHCLVPDLEKITNSSFYWGKMDRYEAERLLEGKPEGTFLLRDSAQEEFLFSVTFRKYGRSLHARIEQSGHKFSFDCHDPCVFTAPTVTGLLEHYKIPDCVMFFEPMLTIPLHRKTTFSLQKLCRATIVSNITYDGINKLDLPVRLKSYLKEYHYKQKLRVKSLDDPLYGCT